MVREDAEGAVREGAVREGAVKVGAVRVGAVREGAVREVAVREGAVVSFRASVFACGPLIPAPVCVNAYGLIVY